MPTAGQQTIAIKPIAVPSDVRDVELEVKVTAPRHGGDLPVIVFSHGNAWSMDGYEPLVDRWAAAAAYYSVENRQFLLPYEAVAEAENPDRDVAEFLHTTYRAAADLGGWDRQSLEDDPHRWPQHRVGPATGGSDQAQP